MPAFKITPTDEQIQCVDAALQLKPLQVRAYAGAAKTTTLKLIAQALSPKKCLYLAFNRVVVNAGGFPANVTMKTFHQMAYAKCGRAFGRRLDVRLTGGLVASTLGLGDLSFGGKRIMSAADLGAYLLTTVDRFCRDLEPVIGMEHMPMPALASADITPQDIRRFLWSNYEAHAQRLWTLMSSPANDFPTRHCVYLKLWALSSPVITGYDVILFDEAQDADPLMLAIMGLQRVPVIYVGDPYQQIYSWRGAIDAMTKIRTDNVACLTQSFRFGNDLASMADMLLCAMGSNVPLRGNPAVTTELGELDRPTAVLCRTNAGVSKWVMEAVRNGDTDFAATGLEDAIEFFESAVQLKKGKPGKGQYKLFSDWGEMFAYARTQDGSDLATFVYMEREYGAEGALSALKKVSGTDVSKASRVVSTVHRAKGMEWDTVVLGDDFRGPTDPRYQEEDARLFYVAMTRAKTGLDMTRADDVFVDLLTHGMAKVTREEQQPQPKVMAATVGTLVLSEPVATAAKRTTTRRSSAAKTWSRRRYAKKSYARRS